ncbi:hypothetical protein ASG54_13415 [Aureimonas sp. Leaf460]|nr:hypothetical protein ASG62_09545 [Aureimonas sp. Leaf427]KQT77224.1 hypothetical protein ASG54_13415 [Aureimonas sp. Leaf460]
MIVAALKSKAARLAQKLMDLHLADIENRVRLNEGHSDRHAFMVVLENFSGGAGKHSEATCRSGANGWITEGPLVDA